MEPRQRWLVVILRLGGVLTGLAVFTVFLPESWMASTHEALGLGPFPAAPITDYMARTLSAMYAFHGALLLMLSTDVERFRPLVRFVGWATAVLGAILLGVDLSAPMPPWWTLGEGPWVMLAGGLIAWLSAPRRGSG